MKILAIWNAVVFAVYGFDKYNAINRRQRVNERTLLWFAFLFGGFGSFFGMIVFRHKIRHRIFIIGVPIAILVNIISIHFLGVGIEYLMYNLGK